jgi:HD-GYP domain-containing protein (c-di-GMP phosphodiesterase class II)
MVPLKQNIIVAAKLHDIGKIGIKESILMKNDKLTAEENEQMQQHPIITAKILEPMDELKDVVEIVRHHHERYDGTGYPDGLKGNAIPFGARLLALVDAFDAMTSVRPYRDSLSFEEAVSQIRNNLGTQFDPQLGEKFLLHLELGDLDLPDFF